MSKKEPQENVAESFGKLLHAFESAANRKHTIGATEVEEHGEIRANYKNAKLAVGSFVNKLVDSTRKQIKDAAYTAEAMKLVVEQRDARIKVLEEELAKAHANSVTSMTHAQVFAALDDVRKAYAGQNVMLSHAMTYGIHDVARHLHSFLTGDARNYPKLSSDGTNMNREAFRKHVEEDLAWLVQQPQCTERMHIAAVLEQARDDYKNGPSRGYGEELALRRLLLLRHGCGGDNFYTDDGELQCNKCKIDFLRNYASEIEERFMKLNREQAHAAMLDPTTIENPKTKMSPKQAADVLVRDISDKTRLSCEDVLRNGVLAGERVNTLIGVEHHAAPSAKSRELERARQTLIDWHQRPRELFPAPMPKVQIRYEEDFGSYGSVQYVSPDRVEREDNGSYTAVVHKCAWQPTTPVVAATPEPSDVPKAKVDSEGYRIIPREQLKRAVARADVSDWNKNAEAETAAIFGREQKPEPSDVYEGDTMNHGHREPMQTITPDPLVHKPDERNRPSVLFRPSLMLDGDQWCALYGCNLQVGVVGFGETPDAAMRAFDKEWTNKPTRTPRTRLTP